MESNTTAKTPLKRQATEGYNSFKYFQVKIKQQVIQVFLFSYI